MNKYDKKKSKKKWIPPPMSAEYLREATTEYLERYMPSTFQLKQVLWRKIDKNIQMRSSENRENTENTENTENRENRSKYETMVQEELDYRKETGALDDRRFAEAWVESLHKKGKSKLQIRVKLQQKGIDNSLIQQVLEKRQEDEPDYALSAAIQYAQKKRLGPFQSDSKKREERYQKDVAAMMRAGHTYDNIKKIMACHTLDEIAELY